MRSGLGCAVGLCGLAAISSCRGQDARDAKGDCDDLARWRASGMTRLDHGVEGPVRIVSPVDGRVFVPDSLEPFVVIVRACLLAEYGDDGWGGPRVEALRVELAGTDVPPFAGEVPSIELDHPGQVCEPVAIAVPSGLRPGRYELAVVVDPLDAVAECSPPTTVELPDSLPFTLAIGE